MKPISQNSNFAETFGATGHEDPAGLLWLASLITGEPESALDAVLESLDGDEEANPFFTRWMMTWARKLVIVKALGKVTNELAESQRRLELVANGQPAKPKLPQPGCARALDELQLKRALEAIDIFPRCVLLLTVFERLQMDDAVMLLDAGKETHLNRAGHRPDGACRKSGAPAGLAPRNFSSATANLSGGLSKRFRRKIICHAIFNMRSKAWLFGGAS